MPPAKYPMVSFRLADKPSAGRYVSQINGFQDICIVRH